MSILRWSSILVAAALAFACGDDGDDKKKGEGTSFTVAKVKPPVEKNTPDGFLAAALMQDDAHGLADPGGEIKSRLYNGGPTDIMRLLDDIDSAMAGIEKRADGKVIPCLEGDAVTVQPSYDIGSSSWQLPLSMKLNCYENIEDQISRFFGQDGDDWYLFEESHADGTSASGHAVHVSGDNDVDMWLRVGTADFDGSRVLAHLTSDESSGEIEYTHTGNGVGFGCGLHMKSNADYIFVTVTKAAESGEGISKDCAGSDGISSSFCLSAETLEEQDDTSACEDDGLDDFGIDTLTYTNTGIYTDVVTAFLAESAEDYDVPELTFEDPEDEE